MQQSKACLRAASRVGSFPSDTSCSSTASTALRSKPSPAVGCSASSASFVLQCAWPSKRARQGKRTRAQQSAPQCNKCHPLFRVRQARQDRAKHRCGVRHHLVAAQLDEFLQPRDRGESALQRCMQISEKTQSSSSMHHTHVSAPCKLVWRCGTCHLSTAGRVTHVRRCGRA